MESAHEDLTRAAAPVASMTSRVAELWRSQGGEFLERTHEDVIQDVTRLRNTSIEVPSDPGLHRAELQHRLAATVGSTVHRLNDWDHAVMHGLRTWRDKTEDDSVDLRTAESIVDLTVDEATATGPAGPGDCAKHLNHAALETCRKCGEGFCDDYLLRPGAKVEPLCLDCALVMSGIRRANH
jgi:hypothetical protein